MERKYNILAYKKRKTYFRLDVLLFIFYAYFLHLIFKNKKFEAQPEDYEYFEKLKTELDNNDIFHSNNNSFSTSKWLYGKNNENDGNKLNKLKIKKGKTNNKGNSDNTFKPIIIGKYNLIYIFYSIEFVCLLIFIAFHLLTFLLSQWNLSINLFIAYIRLSNKERDKYIYNLQKFCTHIYIKPIKSERFQKINKQKGLSKCVKNCLPNKNDTKQKERFNTDYNLYKPKSILVELKKENNDIYFFYKHKKYIFNYETLNFESVKHFDIFNLPFYLNWKGLIECEHKIPCQENLVKKIHKESELLYIDSNAESSYINGWKNLINNIKELYEGICFKKNTRNKCNSIGNNGELNEHVNYQLKDGYEISGKINKKIGITNISNINNNFDSYHCKKNYFEIPYDLYVHNNLSKYGENIYDIPSPCFKKLLYEAMLSPFFIFQFFSIILWMLDSYWYFGIFSIFILIVLESQLINKRIREFNLINSMKMSPQNVYVYRNLQWKIIKSNYLLPGDIYILTNDINGNDNICTCETLLLEGMCITDESILTGESIPLIKASIDKCVDMHNNDNCNDNKNIDEIYYSSYFEKIDIKNKHKKHVVYAGSNILLTKNENTEFNNSKLPITGCVGIVLKNGFSTYQGKLVRTIINTSEKINSSSTDSIIFLFILLFFSITSCVYVVYTLLKTTNERNLYKILLSASHIITAVIPPEFPITLSLGVTISIVYLYNLKIYCTEPFRLPFSGKSNICAFDKTGTLTEDNMIVLGLFGLDNKINHIYESNQSIINKQRIPFLSLAVISGCHSLCTVNNKLLGDPLEKNSFLKLNCNMKNLDNIYVRSSSYVSKSGNDITSDGGNKFSEFFISSKSLTNLNKNISNSGKENRQVKNNMVENFFIYKRFFFSSDLQRMTCILQHTGYEGDWYGELYESDNDTNAEEFCNDIENNIINKSLSNLNKLKKKKKRNMTSNSITGSTINRSNHKNDMIKQYIVVSKGSPEIMKNFLKEIPENYDKILNSLSIKGYRVICLAANILDNKIINKNLKREKIEKNLYFCGFLAFLCPIKISTPIYISDIKNAGIKNIMITGDNALTACQVAQDVNMIPSVKDKDILILKLKESYNKGNNLYLKKCETSLSVGDDKQFFIDEIKKNTISNEDKIDILKKETISVLKNIYKEDLNKKKIVEHLINIIENEKNINNMLFFSNRENKKIIPFFIGNEEYIKLCSELFTLCITGNIIEYFLRKYKNNINLIDMLINKVHIFCRVSPKNKEIIIKTLNKLGNITIMCGDGTNDMAALKAAHVGISLLSIKICYKNKDLKTKIDGNSNYMHGKSIIEHRDEYYENNVPNINNCINDYNNVRAKYGNIRPYNLDNNMNAKYYEQIKLYNERKKQLENMMKTMDDSLPLIKLGEASIASPFTYKGNDIKCVKEIISCGRCALSKVIMMYKLMIINSLITAFSVSILTLDGVKLSDAQTTVISLLYTTFIVLISKTTPLESISSYAPPNSLFNITVVLSLLCQVIVHFSILIYGWIVASSFRDPYYVPDLKGDFSPNIVNTCIYYLIYCINLSIFLCNYEGLPFMLPLHKNKELVYIFIGNFFFLFLNIMNIVPYINYFFSLVPFPTYRLKFLFLSLMILDILAPYMFCNFIRYIRLYIFQKYKINL
ncbi:cation transporting ATPase, putative [Plasmodium berghei]|uniref:Cation transporting ATPase, putative n=2 Tax=Plasmodium berghei TaxID=5821 RepID=A0A509AGS0_PLABA|nr:cation transporting ATPase, putative [Plasmodium berghei ANKA]CXH89432.1 cation transporting ATPase, putative [Plasmodium berghei]SCL90329.1 cation transporting ATPase, putative [Plasmodium berghei]SCM15270.1 cation transporting ATPase, putative [Plasmodium berghei]SCM17065.1 cation transporting ATPase, putative [Plasmodium berghei]SCN21962.1 cation transporting ATPase, putative [Plasmodium berghei]|eukprot:XP_034419845.1 cation transporting ATPase, putative [Plasmodium berghei ANKA]